MGPGWDITASSSVPPLETRHEHRCQLKYVIVLSHVHPRLAGNACPAMAEWRIWSHLFLSGTDTTCQATGLKARNKNRPLWKHFKTVCSFCLPYYTKVQFSSSLLWVEPCAAASRCDLDLWQAFCRYSEITISSKCFIIYFIFCSISNVSICCTTTCLQLLQVQ